MYIILRLYLANNRNYWNYENIVSISLHLHFHLQVPHSSPKNQWIVGIKVGKRYRSGGNWKVE